MGAGRATREQPPLRAALAIIRAQQVQQRRREHHVPVLTALALVDPDQHAVAVNVVKPQIDHPRHLQLISPKIFRCRRIRRTSQKRGKIPDSPNIAFLRLLREPPDFHILDHPTPQWAHLLRNGAHHRLLSFD